MAHTGEDELTAALAQRRAADAGSQQGSQPATKRAPRKAPAKRAPRKPQPATEAAVQQAQEAVADRSGPAGVATLDQLKRRRAELRQQLGVRVTPQLAERLRRFSVLLDVPQQEVVEMALTMFLDAHEGSPS